MPEESHDVLRADEMSGREKYRLLTSVVVPRPIGWISTRSADGQANLAPFSYFGALSSDPMLVGVSIGFRGDEPKDSLQNIRETGVFCANMVTARHLEAMNASSGDYPAAVSEFDAVGIAVAEASEVDAPLVADCPVVLECRLFKEVDLGAAPNSLCIGEVVAVRLGFEARELWDDGFLDTSGWGPVGRLWAGLYSIVDRTQALDRPVVDRSTRESG